VLQSADKKKPAHFSQICALICCLKHPGETWDGECNGCGPRLP